MSLAVAQTSAMEARLEFSSLGQDDHCPLGMYVFPSSDFEWHAVLFVHRGYYAGAVLHFRVLIPPSYPASAPSVVFDSPIFHPLVDPVSGRMRLDSRFPQWRARRDFIHHVLAFVKASLKRQALDSLRESVCANQEAYRLYRSQTTVFHKLASQSAALSSSSSALYTAPPISRTDADAEPSPIRFRKLDAVEEKRLREKMEEEGERKLAKQRQAKSSAGSSGLD
ncbi:hypothetical protein JCM8547_003480 [Rhodosporidiobolus lusitaniae]